MGLGVSERVSVCWNEFRKGSFLPDQNGGFLQACEKREEAGVQFKMSKENVESHGTREEMCGSY
jgi:hypothetical protein